MFIAYMLELHRTLLVVCLHYIAHYLLLLGNTCVLTLFCHRTICEHSLTYVTFAMKIMAGRINLTEAQLTALINEQVAAALAAAQAGGIPCSRNSH